MKVKDLFEAPKNPGEASFLKQLEPFRRNLEIFLNSRSALFRGIAIPDSKLKRSSKIIPMIRLCGQSWLVDRPKEEVYILKLEIH